MSTRIIKTKTKSTTTNPVPPPQPKGIIADTTEGLEPITSVQDDGNEPEEQQTNVG